MLGHRRQADERFRFDDAAHAACHGTAPVLAYSRSL